MVPANVPAMVPVTPVAIAVTIAPAGDPAVNFATFVGVKSTALDTASGEPVRSTVVARRHQEPAAGKRQRKLGAGGIRLAKRRRAEQPGCDRHILS
jgi:hypothetical protein